MPVEEVDALITDAEVPRDTAAHYRAAGINLEVAAGEPRAA
jgi:hypothetical protein